MKAKKVEGNGLFFHTETFGNPTHPACLLIAGAMATARFWTDSFCRRIADAGFFVIRYDHRDIGESSGVDWTKSPYTLSDLARDAVCILDAYRVRSAHFVGHSMGGYIVQHIALEFSQRTLSICSISGGPIGATPETDQPLTNDEKRIQESCWKVLLARKDGPTQEETIRRFMPIWKILNGHFTLDEPMADAYTRDLVIRSRHPIRAGNNHELVMHSLDLEKGRGTLKKIAVPTLIIHGNSDPLSLPRNSLALAHAIPGAELAMIVAMGHMMFHRRLEEEVANLVIEQMQCNFRPMSTPEEKRAAVLLRQKYFFDRVQIHDPYLWTFDHKDHLHFILYEGSELVGYAHIQLWPEARAAIRIIVIEEKHRGRGLGRDLLEHCERRLKARGIRLLQAESRPDSYDFYKNLRYDDMPFNDPDGEPTHPDDRAMGKFL
jgi:pimeloyl-ACP methyl ester carboxylesterase